MTADHGEVAEIRQDLRQMRWYVEDDELRARATDWIRESHDKSDADTAREFLEQELNKLLAEYEMYHAPQLGRGEDGFPDACSDCRHYGSACPVLLDDIEVRWRERALEEAESEQDARRVYQQQAIDVSCQRIPALLDQWDTKHAPFVRRGQEILSEVEESLLGAADDAGDQAPDEPAPALPDGGEQ